MSISIQSTPHGRMAIIESQDRAIRVNLGTGEEPAAAVLQRSAQALVAKALQSLEHALMQQQAATLLLDSPAGSDTLAFSQTLYQCQNILDDLQNLLRDGSRSAIHEEASEVFVPQALAGSMSLGELLLKKIRADGLSQAAAL